MTILSADTFTHALELLRKVRQAGFRASYWPSGGDKDFRTSIPVAHNVIVKATHDQLKGIL